MRGYLAHPAAIMLWAYYCSVKRAYHPCKVTDKLPIAAVCCIDWAEIFCHVILQQNQKVRYATIFCKCTGLKFLGGLKGVSLHVTLPSFEGWLEFVSEQPAPLDPLMKQLA